jgi:hypothetical protein
MESGKVSSLVMEYRTSRFAKVWHTLWKVFPKFSCRHSPFFFFDDGAVLWNQGYGSIAFLDGDRSLTIPWTYAGTVRKVRLIQLSEVSHWDSPHDNEGLDNNDVRQLRTRLIERFQMRGEKVDFR